MKELLIALLPALVAGEGPGTLDGGTIGPADLSRAVLVDLADAEPISASNQPETEYLRGFLRGTSNDRRSTVPPSARSENPRPIGEVNRLAERAGALARDGLTNGALFPRGRS
ncbi:hypothetical protein ACFXBB_06765 [Streptomyces scopuliridis]|uniref:hypothetical protein n=1 Tax=Streptomyces scopuliridis TaxID=452529 RepID=UPI0036B6F605